MAEERAEYEAIAKGIFLDLVHLLDLWHQYEALFSSEWSVKVLNESAPWFFACVQRLFVQEMVLSISRLTDPERSGANRNASLEALLGDPRVTESPEVQEELAGEIRKAMDASETIRELRHKSIAHRDREVVVGSKSLGPLPLDEARAVMDHLVRIHELYGTKIRDVHSDYEMVAPGGAKDLLEALRDVAGRIERDLQAQEKEDLRRLREARGAGSGEEDSGNRSGNKTP